MVPRNVVINNQELRMMLPNQVHSPSLAWSYHSNWSDGLSLPHFIPPSTLVSYYSQLGLGDLGKSNSWTEVPLIVPEMPSPNIPNRESRHLGFGKDRCRGVWAPR